LLPLILILIPYVLLNPRLRNQLGHKLKQYPRLRYTLRLVLFKLGFIAKDPRKESGQVNANNNIMTDLVQKKPQGVTNQLQDNEVDIDKILDHIKSLL
jgi:hypothetical protein